jgi:stage II sporulation protein M
MKSGNFFVRNYSKCWKFFRESRWHMVFALGLFLLLFTLGFLFPVFFKAEIFEFIKKLSLSIEGLGAFELVTFIFFNNLKASFMAMVLGISFGIFPVLMCATNGYLLGFVSRFASERGGIITLWRIAPHGIFELPAVIFSIGIGIKIGTGLIDKKWRENLKYNYKEGLRFFVFVVIPLLLIAGIIEGLLIATMS